MKKIAFLLLTISFCSSKINAQNVNGSITYQNDYLTVIKLWGTHEERGFAYGYLLGEEINEIYQNYIMPQFGSYLSMAKQIIEEGEHISIDSAYIEEAIAVMAGVDSAGFGSNEIDHIDLLVANSMLDIQGLGSIFDSLDISNGCSSLISWGDATEGTTLNRKSVISRHLDWSPNNYLISNQVVAVHFPLEENMQPWLQIGFSGQISVLSGLNNSGVSAFQHMMSDFYGSGNLYQAYEPVWFSLRKALEHDDYNNDGMNNVEDVKAALSDAASGYADGFIITASAPNYDEQDSTIALVAEVAPESPTHVFRTNAYADSIPGDNLYAANYEIKRNNHMHFCSRYNAVVANINDGTMIDDQLNWDIMKNYSNSQNHNIQFMQVIPESRTLKLSFHNLDSGAYLREPLIFNLDELFSSPEQTTNIILGSENVLKAFPNPANEKLNIKIFNTTAEEALVAFHNLQGMEVFAAHKKNLPKGWSTFTIDTMKLPSGFYVCVIKTPTRQYYKKVVISK